MDRLPSRDFCGRHTNRRRGVLLVAHHPRKVKRLFRSREEILAFNLAGSNPVTTEALNVGSASGPMRLFVTKASVASSFGGLSQADAFCNAAAQAANKGGP